MTTATSGGSRLYLAVVLSVVIPTRDRNDALAHTLARLSAQRPPPEGFEIVVVDNGSRDRTPELLEQLTSRGDAPIRSLREPRRGPAAARNAGVAAAAGNVVLFVGDDIAPQGDDLLSRHATLHRERPAIGYVVLGRIAWTDRHPVTPFMRWLETGPQFAFASMAPGRVSAAEHFYTSHVSIKRELLVAAGGFDVRFEHAAVEDMELGLRLDQAGAEVDYHPELLALHDHPMTVARWVDRMRVVGRYASLHHRIHPEHQHPNLRAPRGLKWAMLPLAVPPARLLARARMPEPLRRRGWRILHHAAYAEGYRESASMSSTAIAR